MIHVLAIITAKPGMRQAILDELLPLIPEIHAEDGCIEYSVGTDTDLVGRMHKQTHLGPETFVCIEKWESLAHLEAHSTSRLADKYLKTVDPMMASRVVHFLRPNG